MKQKNRILGLILMMGSGLFYFSVPKAMCGSDLAAIPNDKAININFPIPALDGSSAGGGVTTWGGFDTGRLTGGSYGLDGATGPDTSGSGLNNWVADNPATGTVGTPNTGNPNNGGVPSGYTPDVGYVWNDLYGSGANTGINTGGGGGGGDITTGSNNTNPGTSTNNKAVEKRTDCPPSAASNAATANTVITATPDLKGDMGTLGKYAQDKMIEYSMAICKNGTTYSAYKTSDGDLQPGDINGFSSNTKYDGSTVFQVHTHLKHDKSGVYCLSPKDIKAVMDYYTNIKNLGGNFQGIIAIGADGSQYMVYIEDASKLTTYINKYGTNFVTASNEFDGDSELGQYFEDAYLNLIKQGFSYDNARSYATQYVLGNNDVGLKLYKKASGENDFKEMITYVLPQVTGQTAIIYTPKICQ
jgi:hypothetical protein